MIVQMIRKASCLPTRQRSRRYLRETGRRTHRRARARIVVKCLAPLPEALIAPIARLVRKVMLVRFEGFEGDPAVDGPGLSQSSSVTAGAMQSFGAHLTSKENLK